MADVTNIAGSGHAGDSGAQGGSSGADDTPLLEMKVWGPYACFTRTEASVERVSYECMTPAAARNMLAGVLWKPEFRWEVREIQVLRPIQWATLTRNEVADKAPASGRPRSRYFANESGARKGETQRRVIRSGLVLKDVAYIIRARLVPEPHAYAREKSPWAKYADMFSRRLKKGRCKFQPYFGMREHQAYFGVPDGDEEPVNVTMDLGPMRYDVLYEEHKDGPVRIKKHPTEPGGPLVRVKAMPRVLHFNARLERGVLRVPPLRMMLRAGGVRRPVGMTVEGL